MAEHAPGPWKRSDTIFPAVEDATGKRVGMFHVNTRSGAEMEANCRLAALAPTLLEHVCEAINTCETCRGWTVRCQRCERFLADLAKLDGDSP